MSRSRDLANLGGDATGLETLTVSDITDLTASVTELNYSDGVSSAIQTQLGTKAPIASPTFTGTIGGGAIGSAVTMSANQACVKTALNAGGSAPVYACRAWVNFNGTGTVAIRGNGNVSSITDDATGKYTINYTTAMSSVNYVAVTSGWNSNGHAQLVSPTAMATGSVSVFSVNYSVAFVVGTAYDYANVYVSVFE